MPPKSRTYQPARVRAALAAQNEALRAAVHRLTAEDLERPTRLGTWRVRELVAHLSLVLDRLPAQLTGPEPAGAPLSLSRFTELTAAVAETVDAEVAAHVAAGFTGPPGEVAARFDRSVDAARAAVDGTADDGPGRPVAMRFGPMALSDFLVTRLVETVVHADDLAGALGPAEFPHDRQAVAAVTRLLADAFADRVPGGAVELRVPPYAVVQAVEGPRHTRGTPPNVVETDPLTWIRLATGRVAWPAVAGTAALSASGERSDLRGYLPLLG
ncbi:sterol carrier family protein [Kitasatospora sp. NPDC056327]|uniref:maleylpyruvate isomerase family mycothiol-dependent enzyme n=1 Tax=Kitasatospora sp. NPDC056327 TaxID=3345785 RepID=UPI0035D5C85B